MEQRHFSYIRLKSVLISPQLYKRFEFFFKALAQDQKAALEGLLGCCRGLESIFVCEVIILCLRILRRRPGLDIRRRHPSGSAIK